MLCNSVRNNPCFYGKLGKAQGPYCPQAAEKSNPARAGSRHEDDGKDLRIREAALTYSSGTRELTMKARSHKVQKYHATEVGGSLLTCHTDKKHAQYSKAVAKVITL
eukprot:6478820-Amphidinium_carterae.2